ncbi:MAG TPA: DUF998 domain-containing protein [Candidatus Dormibacteraeota bacterium]
MSASVSTVHTGAPAPACSPAGRLTRSLLGYGVIAGPFYVAVVLVQALLRPGFDLGRDDVSLLSNGSLGWIQIGNFLITGLMVIACAVGIRRALVGGRGATWGPLLLSVYGIGLIGAGLFTADPMNGFPAGAPAGRPDVITVHGMLHIAAAGIGFLCFVAACFVFARRFAGLHRRGWTAFSLVTGVVFLAAFAGVASGSGSPAVVIAFWFALLVAWAWLAALAVHLYRRVPSADGASA